MKHEDRIAMDKILTIIRDELRELVNERVQDLFRAEFRKYYPGPWPIIEDQIDKARDELQNFDLEYAEGVGLRRVQLSWKKDQLVEETLTGNLKGFLSRADTILESFAKVIPLLEPVIQYKKNVEASIDHAEQIRKTGTNDDRKWRRVDPSPTPEPLESA